MHFFFTQGFSFCKYYRALSVSSLNIFHNDIFIHHINIRSLNNDIPKFLRERSTRPTILCLTETRLKQISLVNTQIPGYRFCLVDSVINAGEVESIYRKKLIFNVMIFSVFLSWL